MTDDQIKHMVNRFLSWRLPEHFHPDAGISFEPRFNVGTPYEMAHNPTGTNLFDADQADKMVRYMLEDLPERNAYGEADHPGDRHCRAGHLRDQDSGSVRRAEMSVVQLHKAFDPDDIAATLRRIADDFEKGEFGLMTTCLVVMGHTEEKWTGEGPKMQRERYELFGCGPRCDAFTTRGLLLTVATRELHGGDE